MGEGGRWWGAVPAAEGGAAGNRRRWGSRLGIFLGSGGRVVRGGMGRAVGDDGDFFLTAAGVGGSCAG
jgi:hypothetical protein